MLSHYRSALRENRPRECHFGALTWLYYSFSQKGAYFSGAPNSAVVTKGTLLDHLFGKPAWSTIIVSQLYIFAYFKALASNQPKTRC